MVNLKAESGKSAAEISAALHGRRSGDGRYMARCPVHQDRSPSLSITERDGTVLVHCFSGCPQSDVIAALRSLGLWPERPKPEWTPEERAAWAKERAEIDRILPTARLWRRAAVETTEQALAAAKAEFFNSPDMESADPAELPRLTKLLARLERLDGRDLVAEYREWEIIVPNLTAAMVRAARSQEQAERRALERFLQEMDRAEVRA